MSQILFKVKKSPDEDLYFDKGKYSYIAWTQNGQLYVKEVFAQKKLNYVKSHGFPDAKLAKFELKEID